LVDLLQDGFGDDYSALKGACQIEGNASTAHLAIPTRIAKKPNVPGYKNLDELLAALKK